MSIYKIALLNSVNEIAKYYIFSGKETIPDVENIFSSDEMLNISKNNIELINVNEFIYIDDTIEIVKKKLTSKL